MGDWDRHPDQWRWAGFEHGDLLVFRPVPRDRDWALARMDGFILRWFRRIAQGVAPHLVGFAEEYPSALALTWSGRALDRQFLTGLEWSTWEAIVSDVQRRLSDAVIQDGVEGLPPAYYDRVGDFMTRALIQRRDNLLLQAREFYDLLARNVDVFGTDEEEYALVEWLEGDQVRVRLWEKNSEEEPRGEAFYDRTFLGSETDDVRIYLLGEQDRATVRGNASSSVTVRIVGGGRADVLIDETSGSGRVHFHDDRGDNQITQGAEHEGPREGLPGPRRGRKLRSSRARLGPYLGLPSALRGRWQEGRLRPDGGDPAELRFSPLSVPQRPRIQRRYRDRDLPPRFSSSERTSPSVPSGARPGHATRGRTATVSSASGTRRRGPATATFTRWIDRS